MGAPRIKWAFPNGVNPGQHLDFLLTGARKQGLKGGAGSGKSETVLRKGITYGMMFGGSRTYIGQPVLKECKQTTIPHFFEIIESCGAEVLFQNWTPMHRFLNRDPLLLTLLNGHQFQFMGFNQESGLGSIEAGCIIVSEAYHPLGGKNLPRNTFHALEKGLRSPHAPCRFMMLEFNPPPRSHWLYDEFGEDGKPGRTLHTVRLSDNAHNLPDDHVAALTEDFTGPLQQVMLDGDWGEILPGTPAFTYFSRAFHVADHVIEPDGEYPLWRSWDFGFRHPFVTFHQYIDGQWRILYCLNPRNVMIDQLWTHVEIATAVLMDRAGREMPVMDCGDPEAKHKTDMGVTADWLRRKGIKLKTRPTQRIEEGVQGISEWQAGIIPGGEPAFVISPDETCEPVIDCCEHGFQRRPDSAGRATDRFIDDGFFKDCADTLRYFHLNALGAARSRHSQPILPDTMATYTTHRDQWMHPDSMGGDHEFQYGRIVKTT